MPKAASTHPVSTGMKANNDAEKVSMRAIIARAADSKEWKECPCGWFYKSAKCPDPTCKLWKPKNGTTRMKLYAHADEDTHYEKGEKLGLEGEPLQNFAHWGYEIEFDCEVNLENGEVKFLAVNGQRLFPVKG